MVLPGMSIASEVTVRSILLVAKKPIEMAKRIALDTSSRSRSAGKNFMRRESWRIAPKFFEAAPDLDAMLKDADAALLIGDPALRLAICSKRQARHGEGGAMLSEAATAGVNGDRRTVRL